MEKEDLASIVKKKGYTIKELIGGGAFGEVYKVISDDDKETYALKRIINQGAYKQDLKSFVEEIEVLKFLHCPFIMKYVDTIKNGEEPFLISEFIEGRNMEEIINEDKKKKKSEKIITEKVIIKWIAQIAIGLNYIHKHKVTHRDLAPKNIMITKTGNVKICDFGFAKKVDLSINMMTSKVGTPFYMAPEMFGDDDEDIEAIEEVNEEVEEEKEEEIKNEEEEIFKKESESKEEEQKEEMGYTNKVDLWALGVIIYQLIKGDVPFKKVKPITKIKYTHLNPKGRNKALVDLVEGLLVDQEKRLSAEDILSKNKYFINFYRNANNKRRNCFLEWK